MKNVFTKSKKGFTIIEVMIVLAIAGLILAIVFLAVPQLQRNSRDNARQSIATRMKAELETYSSNNQGKYPFTAATNAFQTCSAVTGNLSCNDWLSRYINSATPVNIKDPTTGNDTVVSIANAQAASVPAITWAQGNAWIVVGASCTGETASSTGSAGNASSKRYALQVALDRSGTYYCLDNG